MRSLKATPVADTTQWSFPSGMQPKAADLAFDLNAALESVVTVHAEIPEDAFTASILGTERIGNGVVIREDGLILTIGYLITEAQSIWITTNDGRVIPGHPMGYDFASGFGLVQPLGRLQLKPIARGSAASLSAGDTVYVLGRGGRAHALEAELFAKREFAGYWEYVLDEALFTTPAHPEWGGAALVSTDGRLIGIGSLFVQEEYEGETIKGNMVVPIDVLEPILPDLVRRGRRSGLPRPWLGVYATVVRDQVVVTGVAHGGPADRAGVRLGDVVVEVSGHRVEGLPDFFRKVWRLGPAGTSIPLTVVRSGTPLRMRVASIDRDEILHKPRLQ